MSMEEARRIHGPEYPAAVLFKGRRIPLSYETRFSRVYREEANGLNCLHQVSRFFDESASITANQLRQKWSHWSDGERLAFCNECSPLTRQPDFPDMLRFIMEHGQWVEWCSVALFVADLLPQEEAYELLVRALRSVELGQTCNFAHALARTRHASAEGELRNLLQKIWAHPDLWKPASFSNHLAFSATTCIHRLIADLGASPSSFEPHVRQLATHTCPGNREACSQYLRKHYPWLPPYSPRMPC